MHRSRCLTENRAVATLMLPMVFIGPGSVSPIEGWIWRRWGYAKVIGVLEMPRIIKAARGSGEEGVREGEEEYYCLLLFSSSSSFLC